eukprot:789562-Amphidinium_carterae.1
MCHPSTSKTSEVTLNCVHNCVHVWEDIAQIYAQIYGHCFLGHHLSFHHGNTTRLAIAERKWQD